MRPTLTPTATASSMAGVAVRIAMTAIPTDTRVTRKSATLSTRTATLIPSETTVMATASSHRCSATAKSVAAIAMMPGTACIPARQRSATTSMTTVTAMWMKMFWHGSTLIAMGICTGTPMTRFGACAFDAQADFSDDWLSLIGNDCDDTDPNIWQGCAQQ